MTRGLVPCHSGSCGVSHHIIGTDAQIKCGVNVDFSVHLANMRKLSNRLSSVDAENRIYTDFETAPEDYQHDIEVFPALDVNYDSIWKMRVILPSKTRWEGTLPIPGRTSLDDPTPSGREAIDAMLEDGDDYHRNYLIDLLLKGRAEKKEVKVPLQKSPKVPLQKNRHNALTANDNAREEWSKQRELEKKQRQAVSPLAGLTSAEDRELDAALAEHAQKVSEWAKGRAFGMFKPKESEKPQMSERALALMARRERPTIQKMVDERVAVARDPKNVEQKRQIEHAAERQSKIQQSADEILDPRRLRVLSEQERVEFQNLISRDLPDTLRLHSEALDVALNDQGRTDALGELDEQLDYISGEVERVTGVVQKRLGDLQRQHGTFLESKFRQSELDLP